jgi:Family of unknown function (DUF5684)
MNEQMMQQMQMQQMGAGIGIGMIVFYLVIYLFAVYCLARLATKFSMPMGTAFIWALIPIANFFLVLKLAAKPMWWFILMLIPIVNIVISILVWMSISERLGKPGWWGIMIGIVPIANVVFFLMLVFGETKTVQATA